MLQAFGLVLGKDLGISVTLKPEAGNSTQEKRAKDEPAGGTRPGKAKPRGKDAPKDTQEAAAQMLRKFFNRG